MLLEIIDMEYPKSDMVPRVQTIEITAVIKGRNTPLNDLKLKNNMIAKLSPKRKRIFLMSRNEGKSYQTISNELDISLSTVKTQMSRSLADIRSYLHQHSDLTWQLIFLAFPAKATHSYLYTG